MSVHNFIIFFMWEEQTKLFLLSQPTAFTPQGIFVENVLTRGVRGLPLTFCGLLIRDSQRAENEIFTLQRPQTAYMMNLCILGLRPVCTASSYVFPKNKTLQQSPTYTRPNCCVKFKASVGESQPLEGLCLKARANLIVCLSVSNLLRLTEIFP